jgi:hypothetical protein
MTKSKTIKETRKSNFSVTWVYDDDEDAYYLVPASAADSWGKYGKCPVFAEVRCSTRRKSAYVLGMTVFSMSHRDDQNTYYLRWAQSAALKALRGWGFKLKVVEDADC